MGELVRITRTCSIDSDELVWRFTASGGPGGQHANTANTRAEVVFDVASSPSLGPRQRARLLEKLGSSVRVVASDERSQARNRVIALDRLRSRLAAGLHVPPTRVPTRVSRTQKAARVDSKRKHGETKRLRRPASPSDD